MASTETAVKEAVAAAERVEAYEMRQARFRLEERFDVIDDLVAQGEISKEEAQKRVARGKMHTKDEEDRTRAQLDEAAAAGADYTTTAQMIEEVLDTSSKIYVVKLLKFYTGFSWLEKKANRERNRRRKPEFKHCFPPIHRLAHSVYFEAGLGFILCLNGILIGITTSQAGTDIDTTMYDLAEHVFTLIFVLELIVRFGSDGWIWIMELMNFFDFSLIVLTGVLPMWVLIPLGVQTDIIRPFQVLRVLRLIRLVRMVKTVPQFQIFWSLISGLMDCGRVLLWTYMMIFVVLYIFAIFGVYMIGKDPVFADDAHAQQYFGDVPKAMITLFQVMTLDSWSAMARPLMKKSDKVVVYYIVVILVVTLALLNLVTAVIVDNTFEKLSRDLELVAANQRAAMMAEINDLRDLFLELDEDQSGMLDRDEYINNLDNERLKMKFEILQIPENEREELFYLLADVGENPQVSVDAFAGGLRDMQGDAKAKDSFTILKKVYHTNIKLGNLSTRLKQQQSQADELQNEIQELHRQIGGFLMEVREVMSYLAVCIPPEEAKRKKKHIDELDTKLKNRLKELEAETDNTGGKRRSSMAMRAGSKEKKARKAVGFGEAEQVAYETVPEELAFSGNV